MKKVIFMFILISAFAVLNAEWQQVGEQNFSYNEIYDHAIAIDSEETPYVLYITTENFKNIRVEKFNGNDWETVGEDNLIDSNQFIVAFPFIKIDADDNIYISYHYNDVANTEQFHTVVKQLNGNSWEEIGHFTSEVSTWSHGSAFCLDSDGNPYVLYYAGNDTAPGPTVIQKYNGTDWEVISETTTADSWIYQPGMAVDFDDNVYIAYADHNDTAKRVRVDKFNGSYWENIGDAITQYGAIDQMYSMPQEIVFDNNGILHIAAITDPYWSGGDPNYVFERYCFDGVEWSGGVVQAQNGMSVSLTTDREGNAYCAYKIIDGTAKGFVEKFINNEWEEVGNQPVVEDFSLIYVAVNNDPYVLYQDFSGDDERKSSVKKFNQYLNSENDILSFTVPEQIGETIIDDVEHTVYLEVPTGTNVTSLVPTIEISENATISPASGTPQDFSDSVEYTVTAENGDAQVWIADVDFVASSEDDLVPEVTKLIGNYPNPFNPTTTISFQIDNEQNKQAELFIYNLKGQMIKRYEINNLKSGLNEIVWNGLDKNNQIVPSGVYLYKLQAGEFSQIKKMILMK